MASHLTVIKRSEATLFEQINNVVSRDGITDPAWIAQYRLLFAFYENHIHHPVNLSGIRVIQWAPAVARISRTIELKYFVSRFLQLSNFCRIELPGILCRQDDRRD